LGHRGLGTDWLAQVHQHDPGWAWAWQRGGLAGLSTWHGTEGCTPSPSMPWRPRGCGAAVSAPVDRDGCWAWPRCGVWVVLHVDFESHRGTWRAPGCCLPNIEKAGGRSYVRQSGVPTGPVMGVA